MNLRLMRATLLGMMLISIATTGELFALSLDEGKARGLVGETPSGYLESVSPNPSGDVIALKNDINQRRRQEYSKIAAQNGTPLAAVEALAGQKAIEKSAPGQYVQTPNGQWRRK